MHHAHRLITLEKRPRANGSLGRCRIPCSSRLPSLFGGITVRGYKGLFRGRDGGECNEGGPPTSGRRRRGGEGQRVRKREVMSAKVPSG